MAAVPKIWDILKKGVEDGVGKKSPVVQLLFQVRVAGPSFKTFFVASSLLPAVVCVVMGCCFSCCCAEVCTGKRPSIDPHRSSLYNHSIVNHRICDRLPIVHVLPRD
jgi:hypothetical protein